MDREVSKHEDDELVAEQLGQVADEIADRLANHEPVQLSEYVTKYPELADVLPDVFLSLRGLSQWHGESETRESHPEPQGLELGDFRLGRELGRGGMGVVYEAEQLSLRRKVAVKVFPFASVLEPNKLQRFKNEALAAATLEHPHIVPVLAVGVDRSTHFYAMRLISGHSLGDVIRQLHPQAGNENDESDNSAEDIQVHRESNDQRQEANTQALKTVSTIHSASAAERRGLLEQVAVWIRDAAEALHYAHQMGIVHRDVKPANLLIDAQRKVWVADFGLATGILDHTLTMSGDMLGTLPYMSPEQASGSRGIVDHRTDIYSLGVALFETIVGEKPFTSSNRAELLQQVLHDEPRISSATRRVLSNDLVNVALKAIAKDPSDRYNTAQELADDLNLFLRGEPVNARPPTPFGLAMRWISRNRAISATACIVFACLAFAAIVSQVSSYRIRRAAAAVQRHLYVADVRLAAEALEQKNIVQARELLSRHHPADGEPDMRGFAWHYLWKQSHPSKHTLIGHDVAVQAVDWSSDGDRIVSADAAGQLLIWDVDHGTIRRRVPKSNAAISSVRYSPDGDVLATVNERGQLSVFDGNTGALRSTTAAHDGAVRAIDFSPNASQIVTCGEDATICVWDSKTLDECWRVRSHGFRVYDVRFCGDETHVCSVGPDRTLRLWQVGLAQPLREIDVGVHARSLAVSPDGQEIICNAGLGELRKYDIKTGNQIARWKVSHERFYQVAYSADGRFLIATGKDRLSRIVDAHSGEVLRTLAGHSRRVYGASFSPDVSQVVTASADGSCKIYPVKPEDTTIVDEFEGETAPHVTFSSDGRYLALEDGSGNYHLRDNAVGAVRLLPGTHLGSLGMHLEFSATAGVLATCGAPFLAHENSAISVGSRQPMSVDLDMDGDEDLLATVRPSLRLLYQERLDDNQLSPVAMLPLNERRSPQALFERADDVAWELTNVLSQDGKLRRYRSQGDKIHRIPTQLSSGRCDVLLISDLDADGNLDVVADERGEIYVQAHRLLEGKTARKATLPILAEGPLYMVAIDVDVDGRKDLVVAVPRRGCIDWHRQIGPMEFEFQERLIDSLTRPSLMISEDVDGDGYSDIISVDDEKVVWMRWLSPGCFDAARPLHKPLPELQAGMPVFSNTAIWNVHSGRLQSVLPAMCHHPHAMALAPDARLIAIVGDGDQVRLRKTSTGEQMAVIPLNSGAELAFVFSR